MDTEKTRNFTAILATRIYPPETGAAPLRLAGLVNALDRIGIDTLVLTSQIRPRVRSTGNVKRFPVIRDKHGVVRGYLSYLSYDIPLFFRLLAAKRPDVYITEPPPTTGLVTMLVAFLKRRPYVYFAADIWHLAAEGMGSRPFVVTLLKRAETLAWKRASAILAVTDGIASKIEAAGIVPSAVARIGSGIDTGLFEATGEAIKFSSPTFIYAGTMSEFQGAEIFILALARARRRDARIIFFGQGTQRAKLEHLAAELVPGRVEFRGVVPPNEVAEHLRGCTAGLVSLDPDVNYDFVVPTKSLVVVACGRPVIYAGPGPFKRQIQDERLGWASDWDEVAVASAIDLACETSTSASESQRLSKWVQEHHSLEMVADKAAAACSDVIASREDRSTQS